MEIKKLLERKKATALLAVGLGTAALVGCGANPEVKLGKPGVVVEHEYQAPYTTFIMVGKVMVPIPHPEEFYLDVRQCDRAGDNGADQQGCVTAQTSVSESTYNKYPDGSQITFSK